MALTDESSQRNGLRPFYRERITVTAIYIYTREQPQERCGGALVASTPEVLLRRVCLSQTGKRLTDHAYIKDTSVLTWPNLQPGDYVELVAKVGDYWKGGDRRAYDFCLTNVRGVRRI